MEYTPSDDADIKIGGLSFRVNNIVRPPNRRPVDFQRQGINYIETFNVDVDVLIGGDVVYTWEQNVYLHNTSEFTEDAEYEAAIRREIRASIGTHLEKLIKTVLKLQKIGE